MTLPRSTRLRRTQRLIAGVVIGALALGIVLATVDTSEAAAAAAAIPRLHLTVAAFLFVGVHVLRAVRYARLVAGLSTAASMTVCGAGFFAVNTLPFRLGEAARPVLVARRGGSLEAAIAGVVVERGLDLLGLAGLMLFGATLLTDGANSQATRLTALGVTVCLFAIAAAFRGPAVVSQLRAADFPRLAGIAERVTASLRMALDSPGKATIHLALTALIWAGSAAWVDQLLRGLPDLPHSAALSSAVWSATLAGMALAPTPGFVGVFEGAFAGALVAAGAQWTEALATAVVVHGFHWGLTAALGLPSLAVEFGRTRVIEPTPPAP